MVFNNIQAECVSQITDDNNLSNHNISSKEEATSVSESKIQGNIDILPVEEKEADNEMSDLDLLWDSNNDNSNKIIDMNDQFKNVNDSQTNLCSQGSKLLHQTSNVDLKSSSTSSEKCKKENEDMDFDNFTWKSDISNVKENTNSSIEKEIQADNILNCKKRSIPNTDDHEIEGLVKKPKLFINDNSVLKSNEMPLGLVHMPENIPFDDIPSRYPIPIEDALNLTAEERIAFAERRRIDKETQNDENLMAARQGRLHPYNARFNQGPVINPPPICPGSLVTFTPGGQRYEVDLNEGRPTYFRSEYNQLQYDGATIINHRKMMSNVSDGSYLPKILDDDIERCHIAEQRYIERMMSGFVKSIPENCEREEESHENGKDDEINVENDNVITVKDGIVKADNIEVENVTVKTDNIQVENVEDGNVVNDNEDVNTQGRNNDNFSDADDEDSYSDIFSDSTVSSIYEVTGEEYDLEFLNLELILLQFHRDVSVMIFDRPLECLRQLEHIISLDLQPLVFKKNPQLVELTKKLMIQTEFPDIRNAAFDFYDKIKSLFEVPDGVEFEDYFRSQVAELRGRQVTSIFDTVLLTSDDSNAAEPFRRNGRRRMRIHSSVESDVYIVVDEEGNMYSTDDESLESLPPIFDEEDDEEEEEESLEFHGPNGRVILLSHTWTFTIFIFILI